MNLLARFHLYTLDTDAVARALAGKVLQDFSPDELDPSGTVQHLRTRYMRLVAEYGLPAGACNAVADRAWAIVAHARSIPTYLPNAFAFYD